MSSSPLIYLKNTFSQTVRNRVGEVIEKNGNVLIAEIENDTKITVYGIADVGDTVLIKDDQVIAKINKSDTTIIHVE